MPLIIHEPESMPTVSSISSVIDTLPMVLII